MAISTVVEVPALTETKQGILEALAKCGFVEGENLSVDYQNANGNRPTQQQIAKKFVGDAPEVIIPSPRPPPRRWPRRPPTSRSSSPRSPIR